MEGSTVNIILHTLRIKLIVSTLVVFLSICVGSTETKRNNNNNMMSKQVRVPNSAG